MRVLLRQTSERFDSVSTDQPIDFHRRLPGYRESPLIEVPSLAKTLGVAKVLVKDETSRFGLPSFKILGASWATFAALRERLAELPDGPLSLGGLQAWAHPLRPLTLIAATDGNHGRAVARVAQWLGLEARIFVPSFVSHGRCQAIRSEGAELTIVDGVYDDAVDAAAEAAEAADTLLISDTARSTSDPIPQLVTAGYATAFAEVEKQISKCSDDGIDAVAIQAGVGGLASACTSWARSSGKSRPTRVIVVEPESAACVMAALAAGEPIAVSANQPSEMSVLQCGTVSLTAFANLRAGVSCCLAVEDTWTRAAVSMLRSCGILTGPSGAAGVAGLIAAFSGPFSRPVREFLGLASDARLLVFASEAASASQQTEFENTFAGQSHVAETCAA
jgi:diaminopropionate ammonia-lyase